MRISLEKLKAQHKTIVATNATCEPLLRQFVGGCDDGCFGYLVPPARRSGRRNVLLVEDDLYVWEGWDDCSGGSSIWKHVAEEKEAFELLCQAD